MQHKCEVTEGGLVLVVKSECVGLSNFLTARQQRHDRTLPLSPAFVGKTEA